MNSKEMRRLGISRTKQQKQNEGLGWIYFSERGGGGNIRSGVTSTATLKDRFTHSMPFPCRAVNSHMPCRAPAMLRQRRVLREYPHGSRKYPNC